MSKQTPYNSLPSLAIIVAMTRDRVIGNAEKLPWELPQDLQLFKQLTLGGTVIMGRETFDAIGHPLPERYNIVLSKQRQQLPNVLVCTSFIAALAAALKQKQPIFIIGGSEVYRKALPLADELHISWIKEDFTGDRFFPACDFSEWRVCAEEDYPGFRYIRYRRCHN